MLDNSEDNAEIHKYKGNGNMEEPEHIWKYK